MLQNFQTPSLFVGLFLRKLEVQDFKTFAESLPWRLPELDAEPQMAQLPQNARPDQPRVRFGSKDGRHVLEVAPAKIHYRYMPGEIQDTDDPRRKSIQALGVVDGYEKFIPQVTRVHSTMAEHFGAVVNRAGVVTDMIAPVPSSANQRIQQHVLAKPDLFGERLNEFQAVAGTRVMLGGDLQVNRRLAIRSARTGAEGNPDLIINVNVDINTLAEEAYDMTSQDLEKFLRGSCEHIDTKIPLLDIEAMFQ